MSAATSFTLLIFALTQAPAVTLVTSLYRDPALHFTVSYPANLKAQELGAMDMLRKEAPGEIAQLVGNCASVPLTATGPGETRALVLVGLDLDCLKIPVSPLILGPVVKNSLLQGLAKLGTPTVGQISLYKIDGHDAAFTSGTVEGQGTGQKGYGGATCMLIEKHVICAEAIAQESNGVAELLSSQLTFEGHTGQPLVPPEILKK